MRAYRILLVASFCALLCLPSASMLLRPGSHHLLRADVVPYPEFEASSNWLSSFGAYFAANFGQKRRLVQLHNALGYHVLGDLRSNDVLAGREGWLFLKQSLGWESFRSEVPLTQRESNSWKQSLRKAKRRLARKNIPLLYVMVPSKETIYPEFLPLSATRARAQTRMDEMVSVLRDASVDYLDLRAPLIASKSENEPLYDKLDSHWNGRGARVAAQLILQRVAALLERPVEYPDLHAHLVTRASPGDLRSMIALDDYLNEESVALLPRQPRVHRLHPPPDADPVDPRRMLFEVDDASLPNALILRDSFGTALVEPLAEKFRRSLWIWTRQLDFTGIAQARPDIVIVELTERFFVDAPPRLTLPASF